MTHDDARPEEEPPPAPRPTRRMDARSLRGLAHPLRMRILELLTLDGPDTATGLARRLGENTGTVSWHLRHLADHDFIEEETGRGTKRERWWRAVPVSRQLNTTDFRDDPDARGPLSLYVHELVQQHFQQVTGYLAEDWGPEWKDAGMVAQWHDLTLTPDQLAAMNRELEQVVLRHRAAAAQVDPDREAPAAPGMSAARPVIVQLQSFPRRPGPGRPGDDGRTGS
ncbi:ArsR family transcriptional regulator [Streptomyces noursei ZPM]|uniref:Transcriptional regulator n=2 Tax=Streptomyces noursei TaxID=1971 RepID=A0A401QY40_STRNR|nr:helix-turn-helix domain-containing protein [Streptomyces noursei]AKA02964.1 ArsR family transcriptional regulator [Streptomyces noursei ZPM]UWS71469.1 helix-turn-helix domain-containing protein [Streptomyces noursei]GCB90285.1 transcriptional regulator [Streptomyces noursei]